MIVEYHRPQTLDEALALLSRQAIRTLPLGGGTALSQRSRESYAVADLQALGLNYIKKEGIQYKLGAAATLQQVVECKDLPQALKEAAHRENTYNMRQVATVAGALAAADGRSSFATAMLALDARLLWAPGSQEISLGDWLPQRKGWKGGLLITEIILPAEAGLRFGAVANTPDDVPLVCAAVAQWKSGRTRVVLGGFGSAPVMTLDGPSAAGAAAASANAYAYAADQWASAEYRKAVAEKLVQRLLA